MEVEQEDFDMDFESLLDAALGIEPEAAAAEPAVQANSSSAPQPQAHPAASAALPAQKQRSGQQRPPSKRSMSQHASSSAVLHDQISPSPSPAASPLHSSMQQQHSQLAAPCSPCWSSDSMQMHASLGHCSSSDALQQYEPGGDHPGLYSPVREQGSPAPDNCSPLHLPDPVQQQQQLARAATNTAEHTPPQQQQQQVQLDIGSLPREVQMRVLCFLSADALTLLSQTCRYFSSLCAEPVLWRRLFCYRWGKKNKQQNQLSWKARYIERDLTELRAAAGAGAGWAAAAAGDAMQDMFVQAHIARRQQVLPRAAIDDLMLVEDDEVAARVMAWRKARGFDSGPGSAQVQRPADIGQAMQHGGVGSGHRTGLGHRTALAGERGSSSSSAYARRGVVVCRRAASGNDQMQQQQQQGGAVGGGSNQAAAGFAGAFSSHAALAAAGGDRETGTQQEGTASTVGSSAHHVHAAHSSSTAAGSSSGLGMLHSAAAAANGSSRGGGRQAAASVVGVKRPRRRRRWTQIGNVFCDEMTGWVHVCDETCSEKIIEPCSGLLVCPISGQVSDRMMTCAEEAAEEGARGDEEAKAAEAEAQEEEFGGRLARAFAAGYYCNDEEELMRKCGVRLSR